MFGYCSIFMREDIINSTLIHKDVTKKNLGKIFNSLGLAVDVTMKFYASKTKELKLKAKKNFGDKFLHL